jgi:hypothetical protein
VSCLPEDIQPVSAHSAFALPKIARFYLLREGLTGQARDTSSARVACRAGSAQLDTNWGSLALHVSARATTHCD